MTIAEALKQEGKQEGYQIGRVEGINEGVERGRYEGKLEGQKQAAFKIARQLLADGVSPSIIKNATGISENEFIKLEKNSN